MTTVRAAEAGPIRMSKATTVTKKRPMSFMENARERLEIPR